MRLKPSVDELLWKSGTIAFAIYLAIQAIVLALITLNLQCQPTGILLVEKVICGLAAVGSVGLCALTIAFKRTSL